jgi:hypothetical protein
VSAEENGATRRRTFIKAGALGAGAGVALVAGSTTAAASEAGTASFDNSGAAVVLSPGGVANWWFDRGGADFGCQVAGPNILQPQNGARHTFFNTGKAIFSNGYVQYYVSIRNDGGAAAVHNLEGGGVT